MAAEQQLRGTQFALTKDGVGRRRHELHRVWATYKTFHSYIDGLGVGPHKRLIHCLGIKKPNLVVLKTTNYRLNHGRNLLKNEYEYQTKKNGDGLKNTSIRLSME